MDHATVRWMDVESKNKKHAIVSSVTFDIKGEALSRSENLMHNKRQQMPEAYYKKIAAVILKYDHVLLFGPTNAKTELHNYLKENFASKNMRKGTMAAYKMSDKQKVAFVPI